MGINVTPKQRADVEQQLRRTDLTRRVRERLEMVKAAALGDDAERIARWSGRSVATVERWLACFAQGGVAALAALAGGPRAGRPRAGGGAGLAAPGNPPETTAPHMWSALRV